MSNLKDNVKCTISFDGNGTPQEKFKQLKKAIIEATIDIDKETPWQEREPAWLTEMMDVQHRLKNNFFRR